MKRKNCPQRYLCRYLKIFKKEEEENDTDEEEEDRKKNHLCLHLAKHLLKKDFSLSPRPNDLDSSAICPWYIKDHLPACVPDFLRLMDLHSQNLQLKHKTYKSSTVDNILQNYTNYETLKCTYWTYEMTKEIKLYASIPGT